MFACFNKWLVTLSLVACAFFLDACATYYQNHFDFNSEFENGHLQQALETLTRKQTESEGKARFIYDVNKGLLLSLLGKYTESNEYFEKAFLFGEDYRINYVEEAASYFTNPNITVYRGENHEHLMLLYFKAINYLKMDKPDEALIECRRLNIRLNQLNDKFVSSEKLQRDAFIHTLMGIIYQSTRDFNNAFIAYRNAVEVYETDYASKFGVETPLQLKRDLLNAAWWTGFQEEFQMFKTKFGMDDFVPTEPDAELVFFWHNGLAPVKEEWSINFVINGGPNNTVVFRNSDMGISFPFHVEEEKDRTNLSKLEIFRVAFPRYKERPLYFESATIYADGQPYRLEVAEDINKVAFLNLKQRMVQEFGKGLLRAAMKKVTEHSLRKEDDKLGAVIGLVNALTEKADTRNWQTLPHSIYYARVPLKEGLTPVQFSLKNALQRQTDYTFNYTAKKGQTLFHTFSSLETGVSPYRYY